LAVNASSSRFASLADGALTVARALDDAAAAAGFRGDRLAVVRLGFFVGMRADARARYVPAARCGRSPPSHSIRRSG
jgi:hypothetical protein